VAVFQSRVDTRSEAFLANRASYRDLISRLRSEQEKVIAGGRDAQVARHRERGKLLPRERIDLLVDANTAFLEFSTLAAWGQYLDEGCRTSSFQTGTALVMRFSASAVCPIWVCHKFRRCLADAPLVVPISRRSPMT